MISEPRYGKKYAATGRMKAGHCPPVCWVIPTGNMEQLQDEYKAGPVWDLKYKMKVSIYIHIESLHTNINETKVQ